jgi:hypothetical protein
MNRLVLQGYLNTVKYLPNSCLVYIDEHKGGYKKQSGELVPEKYMQWKIAFKGYFKKYISEHFRNGQLVEVVAEMFPFAVVDGAQVEGYSCIGKSTIGSILKTKSNAKIEERFRAIKAAKAIIFFITTLSYFRNNILLI